MSSNPNPPPGSVDARILKRLAPIAGSPAFTLDLHLQAGPGISVLFGPSGAGKSLTLNCLAGFARPDEGRILVNDQLFFDAAAHLHLAPERRRCGYIFQDHALFPHMTVRDNLRFAAAVARPRSARGLHRHRHVNELLETFELADLASRKPPQLSGGQKQRAALARILASEPQLLLLDEPTRGLDARLRTSFYDVLQTMRRHLSVPAVLVTHDLDECFELADSIFLIEQGQFLQAGPRDAVFSKPATAAIARSLGIYTVLPAVIEALDPGRRTSRLTVLDAAIDGQYLPGHLIGDHGFLCVRQFEWQVLPCAGRPSRHQLTLRFLSSTPSARGIRLTLEHGVSLTVSEAAFESLRGADRVCLESPPSAVYFLDK